jgi:hypothetical protein
MFMFFQEKINVSVSMCGTNRRGGSRFACCQMQSQRGMLTTHLPRAHCVTAGGGQVILHHFMNKVTKDVTPSLVDKPPS